jgi:hypothetical protein
MLTERENNGTALALGYAGLLPFIAFSSAVIAGVTIGPVDPLAALVAYGACIASFLGGIAWGAAVERHGGGLEYTWSVLPSLVAWAALLMPASAALLTLIAAFAAALMHDYANLRAGRLPLWFWRLRVQLSLVVAVTLAVTLGSIG